jgi:hypothetical protein
MRMLRDFKALPFQFAQMFQPTTKAHNYRILYVISIIFDIHFVNYFLSNRFFHLYLKILLNYL